jgi:hypothetical protein
MGPGSWTFARMTLPIDFHTHHGAFGSLGSFTLGRFGAAGGFNVHDGSRPGSDEVFVGMARPGAGLRVLPFTSMLEADTSNFVEGSPLGERSQVSLVDRGNIERILGLGTDAWVWPEGRLTLCTPFGDVPDPRLGWEALRDAVLPGVVAVLEFDNRAHDLDATAVFALGGSDPGAALLDIPDAVAIGRRGLDGIAAPAGSGARPIAGFDIGLCLDRDGHPREPHWLGSCFGLAWTVPARTVLRVPVALGWFHEGIATHGLRTTYAYAHLYAGLEDVLGSLLSREAELESVAKGLDKELRGSGLPPERAWILSHAVRGYFGNTQLLRTAESDPIWAVHEGEYAMINTLDLSVDQVFFEERYFPWVVRELADLFASRHAFVDRLRVPGETTLHEGGVSFCHDMGVRNQFSAPGSSSYEVAGLEGCFSHMTQEQAMNWPLLACTHILLQDDLEWARSKRDLLLECLSSLERREHPEEASRRGVPGTDSSRVGTGMEITTYDSLDPALAQARGSLYLTVKLWAAYRGLERAMLRLGDGDSASRCAADRDRVARALLEWPSQDGILPALADGRNRSAILPAIEGLGFPMAWGDDLLLAPDPSTASLLARLGAHLDAVLHDGICLFPDGGWRMSSTSGNSWISKVALCQAVAERVFGRAADPAADRAHVAWLAPGSADWGFTDQIQEGTGIGSKYYPRGVTSILWWP